MHIEIAKAETKTEDEWICDLMWTETIGNRRET
jgi:hypothetical protein